MTTSEDSNPSGDFIAASELFADIVSALQHYSRMTVLLRDGSDDNASDYPLPPIRNARVRTAMTETETCLMDSLTRIKTIWDGLGVDG